MSRILLLPGDGVGPEVVAAAVRVLEASGITADYETRLAGRSAIEKTGEALEPGTLDVALESDAVFLGAVGDDPRLPAPSGPRPEEALFALRKTLQVYANLRPVKPHPSLAGRSPLRPSLLDGVDLVVVRELTGGLYYGARERTADRAFDTMVYTVEEIERIVRYGFELAASRRGKLTSVDKANVLDTSRLWRDTVRTIAADYPSVELDHLYVDNASMQLVLGPANFDVIVTENMFGDILSDEAGVLAGSLGMLPSASLGLAHGGLYEPVHGTAHDILGSDRVNPTGAILSAALLARHALKLSDVADNIERAVHAAITGGALTGDVGGSLGTKAYTDAVIAHL